MQFEIWIASASCCFQLSKYSSKQFLHYFFYCLLRYRASEQIIISDCCIFVGNGNGSIVGELQMHHGILRECIEQLKAAESSRTTLISLLREALHEQVSNFKQVEERLQLHLVKLSVFLSYAYEPCVVNMQEMKIEQVRNQLQVIFTLLNIFRSAMVSFSNRVQ